jgi:hypothetical protein
MLKAAVQSKTGCGKIWHCPTPSSTKDHPSGPVLKLSGRLPNVAGCLSLYHAVLVPQLLSELSVLLNRSRRCTSSSDVQHTFMPPRIISTSTTLLAT